MVSSLNATIKSLNETIDVLKKQNVEQSLEILRLKSKNSKDSSNSSKPSGTNGYKKVITNRREKSTKFKGVIVKNGTELYNKYGLFLSQCISHIQRYFLVNIIT